MDAHSCSKGDKEAEGEGGLLLGGLDCVEGGVQVALIQCRRGVPYMGQRGWRGAMHQRDTKPPPPNSSSCDTGHAEYKGGQEYRGSKGHQGKT